ncbi:hypothetical protein PR202_ga03583 [Eleusine coracana subsp. coracana]|uniref:Uncharacterized protein n=1 Tax=Eleusine coracana subsp. coracana TaxID=191504 RepID=A0AAV5BNR6_ELECO|nr:hypothetical protein PR202_ga03583 [Eleusine coracana subsp. coracana]
MDALVAAALEEVCARLSPGIPVADLWPAVRVAAETAGLPLSPPVKRALWARLLALPVVSLVEGGGDGAAPVAASDPAERDVEEAERRGVRLVASPAIRDNFLGMYERRFAKTDLSAIQKAALECVAASRWGFGVNFKNDVSIHDYLPAMKAICDKLDQASGKALVVSDIKIDLDYRMAYGHRAWRNVLHRLKDAGLVQEFDASVDDKDGDARF